MGMIFCDVKDCLALKGDYSPFCPRHRPDAPEPESIAQEAHRIVLGDRRETYGHPAENFGRTAALWAPILGCAVTAEQVALCMVQVKVAREVHSPKRDNRTDAVGYLIALDLIHQESP